jgi:hypothetical protein
MLPVLFFRIEQKLSDAGPPAACRGLVFVKKRHGV